MIAAGTCSITASQAGNSSYNAAPNVSQSFTVNPATLTITAKSTSKTYGQTVTFAGTEFTTSGLVSFANGDASASVTAHRPRERRQRATVGSSPYNIVPSAAVGTALGNYNITYVNGSLSVTAAALTVTASSGTMTYGGTVPTITASYSGFVNGDTSASLTTQPTCSTTATASSAVGSYPSSCQGPRQRTTRLPRSMARCR